MKGYPVTLIDLHLVRCVVVGGGQVAERKIDGLLQADAHPRVISPRLTEQLAAWHAGGRIDHLARPYMPGDLEGAWLVIAATDRREVNAAVAQEARARGQLINVADDPAAGNFHTTAAVRRGDVLLTASTGGGSPALGKLLRRKLEATFGPEYGTLNSWLHEVRRVHGPTLSAADRQLLYRALASDQVLGWLRGGDEEQVKRYTEDLLSTLPRTIP